MEIFKTVKISSLPDILILSLNRFGYGPNRISRFVDIPNILNLKEFMQEGARNFEFSLNSIIFHEGVYANTGHITC